MTNLDIIKLQLRWANLKRLILWQMDKPAFVCRFCGDHVEKDTLCPKCGMGQEINLEKHDLIALLKYVKHLEIGKTLLEEADRQRQSLNPLDSDEELVLWENIKDYFEGTLDGKMD